MLPAMPTVRRPWPVLALLALSAACDDVGFELASEELHTFAGARVIARVEVSGCRSSALPELVGRGGGPAPAGFSGDGSDGCGDYFICNPSSQPPFEGTYYPGAGCQRPEGYVSPVCEGEERFLAVTVAPSVAPGAHAMGVHVRGCGEEQVLPLTLDVKGPLDLGGFCGASTGDACESDAGCSGPGVVCTSTAVRVGYWLEDGRACVDPVIYGAECRCVQHACTWRLPD